MRVHQLLAALSYGDAIGNEALAIQRQLRAAATSRTSSPSWSTRGRAPGAPALRVPAGVVPETVCIFHFSIGSAAGRADPPRPGPLVVVYHNITPGALLPRLSPAPRGPLPPRRRARRLRRAHGAGARRQRVQPPGAGAGGFAHRRCCRSCWTSRSTSGAPSPLVRRLLRRRPHQRAVRRPHHPEQEDRRPRAQLRVFQRFVTPRQPAAAGGRPPRLRALLRPAAGAGARAARRRGGLHGPGRRRRSFYAYYRLADVFLCLSEHEGFACRCRRRCSRPAGRRLRRGACARRCAAAACCCKDKSPELVAEVLDGSPTAATCGEARRLAEPVGGAPPPTSALVLYRLRPVLEPQAP